MNPAIAEDTVKIRRVAIFVPGMTSTVRLEPKYCLKLFQALWKGAIPDPIADPVRVIPTPGSYPQELRWHVLPSEDACEIEAHRLRNEFGLHKSGEPLFDVVYPADSFETAFSKCLEESGVVEAVFDDEHPAMAVFKELPGVGVIGAKKLIEAGITSLDKLANIDIGEIVKVLGKIKAVKAQEAAIAKLPQDPA
jgi:hypothetical protein